VKYLLPAQTILDLQSTEPCAAITWSSAVSTQDCRMAWISVALAFYRVDREADADLRGAIELRLRSFIAKMRADAGEPFAFTEAHADAWRVLLAAPGLDGLQTTHRQVYATAMCEGLTVVEEATRYTEALRTQGCRIETL
jgi:hypothetical protein